MVWVMEDVEGMEEKKEASEVFGMDVEKGPLEKYRETGRPGKRRWRAEAKDCGLRMRGAGRRR